MIKPCYKGKLVKIFWLFILVYLAAGASSMAIGPDFGKINETITGKRTANKKRIKAKVRGLISGMPEKVLAAQNYDKVEMPTIDAAVNDALQVAKEKYLTLVDGGFHENGRVIRVPSDRPTIGQAIDVAQPGDTVVVAPGICYEQILLKDGVKLVSASTDGGDELLAVEKARLQLPRRTLRTVIDGSRTTPSKRGMVDFDPGVSDKTIIDGFTIRNLPSQNHHTAGHAHGLNIRGASPVIVNCYIKDMGSTGIGSHVVYHDQQGPMRARDFRWANIKHPASAIIYNNIITGSLGLGIGCNHFASPFILGNELFANDDSELGDKPSPGMGNKHGCYATIIANIVHDNPGGGILSQVGKKQGKYGIDRPTHPTIVNNVVYDNGADRPGISAKGAGSLSRPVVMRGNYVYNSGVTGIGLSDKAIGIIEENMVSNPKKPGIAVKESVALKLNTNRVTNLNGTVGIVIIDGSVVDEMIGNAVDADVDAPPYRKDSDSKIKSND